MEQKKKIKTSEAERRLEKTLNKLEFEYTKYDIDIGKPEAYETRKKIYNLLKKQLKQYYTISDC
jgi:hypothetical protein